MKILALDTETTGADFLEGRDNPFVLYGIDDQEKKYKWEFNLDPTTRKVIKDDHFYSCKSEIEEVVENYDLLVFHNGKFDLKALYCLGITFKWRGKYADTQTMSHVLDNITSHKLKDLGEIYLGIPKDAETDLKDAVKAARRIAKKELPTWKRATTQAGETKDDSAVTLDYWLPKYLYRELPEHPKVKDEWEHLCDKYGFNDVELTLSLYLFFQEGLQKEGLTRIYDREIQLIEESLFDMEVTGVSVRGWEIDRQLREFRETQKKYRDTLTKIAPDVNTNSPIQLRKLLFEDWGLPVINKTDTGLASTNKATIKELLKLPMSLMRKQFLEAYQEVGIVTKAVQQNETLKKNIVNNTIFASFNPTGTRTTRFSCYNPNNQQISKGVEYENEFGEIETKYKIRSGFGPKPGRMWFCIDYSQLQLRIFSCPSVANEQELYEALCQGSTDAHTFVGCKIHDCTPESLSPIQRRIAKNVNFGFVFGASPKKIEETAGMPGLWDTVTTLFPHAHSFMNKTKGQVRNHGYVHTPFGYRLFVDYEHKGVNYIVQGAEGDIVKNAMIKCSKYLKTLRNDSLYGSAYMSFNVHDELVFDFPMEEFEGQHSEVIRDITSLMEEAGTEIGIYTPVDVECVLDKGNWGSPQDYVISI